MPDEFERVAIINRGEPAMRFINAVRDFNREQRRRIRTIVLYTTPDRRARFVRESDEAVDLGHPFFVDPATGLRREAYLDTGRVTAALARAGADAVWVGWGFVSERSEFAELCERLGLVFIGPSSAAMKRLGDKISAKQLASSAGIPVIPWEGEPAADLAAARRHAKKLGYPVVLKATAGEGGRGIRRVESEAELEAAFEGVRHESARAFGNATVFVERWIEGARHVEAQVIADNYGKTWAVGLRDCSIQRRFQKIVEEAPASILSPAQERRVREAAVTLAGAARYRNAGTVEFLYDPASQEIMFMEVNARLQVEHPVTELTTGLDLVGMQLRMAGGGRLEGDPPPTAGHAIEVRLNAEDPGSGFAAAPGVLELLRVPTRAGLRLDSGVAEGDEIPAEYDSMFAKLVACGRTRIEALDTLARGLHDSAIVIAGGATNRAFLAQLLQREELRSARADVLWLDRQASAGGHVSTLHADVALLRTAIDVYEAEFELEREEFFASALRMRPVVRSEAGRVVELRYGGHHYRFRVCRLSIQNYLIDVDGRRIEAEVQKVGRFEQWLTAGDCRYRVLSSVRGLTHVVEVDGAVHHISREESGIVRAPAPSVVASVDVRPGDRVSAGQRVALLEAMKMEIPVAAPCTGTVSEVLVLNNAQVSAGSLLVRVMPEEAAGDTPSSRISFCRLLKPDDPGDVHARRQKVTSRLRQFVLGSDLDAAEAKQLVEDYTRLSSEAAPDDPELNRCEDEILNIFVDISSLFRRQSVAEDADDVERLSTGEYLLTYLRTMDSRGGRLPERFLQKLRRALGHYGSDSLDPTPHLKGRLLWIFKSHQNMDLQATLLSAILERRLAHAQLLAPRGAGQEFLRALSQIASICDNGNPALCEKAREVRYRYFDQPVFEFARDSAYAEMESHVAWLAAHPDDPNRAARIQALVDCHYPLKPLLSARFEGAAPSLRHVILEVMTRRYYRRLESFRTVQAGGRSFALAGHELEGEREQLVTAHAEGTEFETILRASADVVAGLPRDRPVVLDIYGWLPELPADPDALEAGLAALLQRAGPSRGVRRVVFALAGPGGALGLATTLHFTFRLGAGGYREEKLYRGLHPMMCRRLQLWRLEEFHIERLPSAEDVYLFRGVARENPKDERLFAIGEVRDVTPVRDARGRVVHLPQMERILLEALAAIRQEQLRRPPEARLHWNRVFLYVWPPVDLSREELQTVARELARHTEGLGLEKVVLQARMREPDPQTFAERVITISNPAGRGIVVRVTSPSDQPLRPLTEYVRKVVRMRQRGLPYPYEVIRTLTPAAETEQADLPPGKFTEYDLDGSGAFVPVERPFGCNCANVVTGLLSNYTAKYPEGMTRVILLGDPSRELGSISEPECRRILAALDLAEKLKLPLEWFTLSAGAKIAMDSGTENMDWISRVLRRLIEFTQAGGEVNVVVAGINVGAQPYWNAEATMLMHTRGILVMMPESAMVLTGKTALDYSGSVSAEDNQGIGGHEHIMGPNGQAQYWACDITDACRILMRHYEHTFVLPGERFPRRRITSDPAGRDVRSFPHRSATENGFASVGEVFSDETNPGRKKPFDIRSVMRAVTDQDCEPLERWAAMQDAETAVVWDAHIGGYPVCLMGFESRPLPRVGFAATDGPELWTSGTLFPLSSKKAARAINSASNNRPLVILANLSGFDGSPESMRRCQLEYGAEIGRAVVNFRGPVIFCVISRYHGGAFVVFSRALNENMEVVALEGTYASVIGGAPAAAVVFAREVDSRTRKDPRIRDMERLAASAAEKDKGALRAGLAALFQEVRSEKLGEVADEFDRVHSVHRALRVGSLDRIIPAADLRPYLIDAIGRGIGRASSEAR